MKWQETVLSMKQLSELNSAMPSQAKYGEVFESIANEQAKVSYEAGMEAGLVDGRLRGINDVVEWISANTISMTTGDHKGDGGLLKRTVWEDEWQAKLKEWGNE